MIGRYSGRQETRIKTGGFVGEGTFEGDIEPFVFSLTPVTETFTLSFRKARGLDWGSMK